MNSYPFCFNMYVYGFIFNDYILKVTGLKRGKLLNNTNTQAVLIVCDLLH